MNWLEKIRSHSELPKVTEEEVARYEKHFELLKEWNAKFNLVSRKSIEDAFYIHYSDSLLLADRAEKQFGALPVIDLGTGAGFPGMILAIRYPKKKVQLLERSEKKQGFLHKAVETLGLANVSLADTFRPKEKTKAFVISRAVLAPADCQDYLSQHLVAGSRVGITVGGIGAFPEARPGFKNILNISYSLPGDFGSRKFSVFECVPRGTKS